MKTLKNVFSKFLLEKRTKLTILNKKLYDTLIYCTNSQSFSAKGGPFRKYKKPGDRIFFLNN